MTCEEYRSHVLLDQTLCPHIQGFV